MRSRISQPERLRALGEKLNRYINKLLDIIFVSNIYCIGCGAIIDKSRRYSLCNDCMENMSWTSAKTCEQCGRSLDASRMEKRCYFCRTANHKYDEGYPCTGYHERERKIISDLKAGKQAYIAGHLADIIFDKLVSLNALENIDILLPVPANAKNERKRGFNQSELIASRVFEKCAENVKGIQYYTDVLHRDKKGMQMKGQSSEERRMNIKGQILLSEAKAHLVKGKVVLLIDDVYTTGATVDECAKVLKSAGATKVCFAGFAIGN